MRPAETVREEDGLSDAVASFFEKPARDADHVLASVANGGHVLDYHRVDRQRDAGRGGRDEQVVPRIVAARMVIEVRVSLAGGARDQQVRALGSEQLVVDEGGWIGESDSITAGPELVVDQRRYAFIHQAFRADVALVDLQRRRVRVHGASHQEVAPVRPRRDLDAQTKTAGAAEEVDGLERSPCRSRLERSAPQ